MPEFVGGASVDDESDPRASPPYAALISQSAISSQVADFLNFCRFWCAPSDH
jgi:hypothetical protein